MGFSKNMHTLKKVSAVSVRVDSVVLFPFPRAVHMCGRTRRRLRASVPIGTTGVVNPMRKRLSFAHTLLGAHMCRRTCLLSTQHDY
jgi:hypothetical protein